MSTVVVQPRARRAEDGSAVTLRPEMAGTLMTTEEYDASERHADDGHRYELIRGLLIVSPPPDERQRHPVGELWYLLRHYEYSHENGHHLDLSLAENGIKSVDNRRIADLVIWAGLGRTPRPKVDVPTIVVEFVSKGRSDRVRDYEEKRREYLAAGSREYWIFDRFLRRMTVIRAVEGGEPEQHLFPEGTVFTTPLLPGFELPIDRLLVAADLFDDRG